jgi:RNA polymerase sigma factor (sigma-70 family)
VTAASPAVFLVDDDAAVRDSLSLLLSLRGYRVRAFAGARELLAEVQPDWAGCLLLDLKMPGMGGLELQAELTARGVALPVVIVTAHGDVASARAAFRAGAADFIEKPIDDQALVAAIARALERDAQGRAAAAERAEIQERLARLTSRERQVLDLVASGRHNREVATQLEISPRTVEVYKARLMEKLRVRRLPDLVRLVLRARGGPGSG